MSEKALIFGTDACPYTTAACEDYSKRNVSLEYKNVKEDKSALDEMLQYSSGRCDQPVIVEDGKMNIGFGGT